MFLDPESALAAQVKSSIQNGDLDALKKLLSENEGLATTYIGNESEARSLLHIATDWPGNFPSVAATIRALVTGGADVNARFIGSHIETPLHWAASSDDVAAIDALLDAGADINAEGAVIAGGTPLCDARAFLQLNAARRLVERGAAVGLQDAAALGLQDHLEREFDADPQPTEEETSLAFWSACHGGQLGAAEFLLQRGADVNVVPPWENATPLDVARRGGHFELVSWLESLWYSRLTTQS